VTSDDIPTDDFVYHSPNGTHYIPPLEVVARGNAIALAGNWRDDRAGFVLALRADGSYRCEEATTAGAASSNSVETGRWTLLEGKLHLIPASLNVMTFEGFRKRMEARPPGPPRDMAAEGLTLEYTPANENNAAPRRVDGLALEGEAPRWSYTSTGQWKWQLRRAR
jgi:hypothetical protein